MVDSDKVVLPARMVNEYVYCPRLFYFEWVQRRWRDNDDTVEGREHHRPADRGGGAMPDPSDDDPPQRTFQVRLEDATLGLSAVVDRVDHDDGTVTPVEYKKGAPPEGGGMWPADRAQLMVHAVLLENAGFVVRELTTSYGAVHKRVSVPWDDEARAELTELVDDARSTAARSEAPLPLVDSPKCPRCSLLNLCMPDETNTLLDRAFEKPRRIVPRDGDAQPLYVTEQGSYVSIKTGRLLVRKGDDELIKVRLIDVSQLVVVGNCQVTSQALGRLMNDGIPIVWLSYGGWLKGWSQGNPSKYVQLRRSQALAENRLDIAAQIVAGKITNQRVFLRRNIESSPQGVLESMKKLTSQTHDVRTVNELLGVEGSAARLYFGQFSHLLRGNTEWAGLFARNGRKRRPPPDPVNALLGFSYGLLVKEIVTVCLGVGLDPYMGVLHADRYGRPAMALDLAEEFRPLIGDSVVVQLINNGEIGPGDFDGSPGYGMSLNRDGRRTVIAAFERRLAHQITHPVFKYTITYRRVLEVQARMMAATLVGELDRYTPLVTR